MVCHGDPALVRVRDGVVMSYHIDPTVVAASAHVDQQCVGCHVDFTYKAPHGDADWVATSKTACRNCHDEASVAFGKGVHRMTVTNGSAETTTAPKPLCGDCHGSHSIAMLTDNPEGQAELHADGWYVCGRCHEDYWDSYDDYYHGRAYKRGAEDAPACWDCHGWHDILPSTDRSSTVHESHLVETCGQAGCHAGVDENYTSYAVFIHGRPEITEDNWLISVVRSVIGAVGRLFGGEGE
jgi:ferredoxin